MFSLRVEMGMSAGVQVTDSWCGAWRREKLVQTGLSKTRRDFLWGIDQTHHQSSPSIPITYNTELFASSRTVCVLLSINKSNNSNNSCLFFWLFGASHLFGQKQKYSVPGKNPQTTNLLCFACLNFLTHCWCHWLYKNVSNRLIKQANKCVS